MVPTVACKGLCHAACGVIPIAPAEREELVKLTGRRVKVETEPMPGGYLMLRMRSADDLSCRYLVRQRCSVYAARPLICRLYGAAEALPCAHGCEASAPLLSNAEGRALIAEVGRIR